MYSVLNRVGFSLCHKLSNTKNITLRRISFLKKLRGKPTYLDKTNYKLIYEFKYIVFPAGFLKTKYIIPLVSFPFILGCVCFKQIQLGALFFIACVMQSFVVVIVSRLANNMIGKIYVNKNGEVDSVIISSIDSKGNRVDECFSPDQLLLSETGFSKLGFLNVNAILPNKKYKINLRNICIYDSKALKTIFDDIFLFINREKLRKKSQ